MRTNETTNTNNTKSISNPYGELSGDEEDDEVTEERARRRRMGGKEGEYQHHRFGGGERRQYRREEEEEEDYYRRRQHRPPRRRYDDEYDDDDYDERGRSSRGYHRRGRRSSASPSPPSRGRSRSPIERRRRRRRSEEEDENRGRPKFGVPEEMEKFHEAELPNTKNKSSRRSFDRPIGGAAEKLNGSHHQMPQERQHGRDIERNAQNRLNMAQQWLQSNGYEETQKQNEILRKRREVYVGNLIQGVVTPNILADVFNAILKKVAPKLCEREVAGNPVVNVIMDSQGSFGFVELRCFEMAQIALRFDKVDVCGRPMNVGRPKGYIEDPRVGDDCPQEVVDSMVEFGGSLDDDEAKAKEKELAKAKAAAAAAAAAKIAAKMKTTSEKGSNKTATTTTEENFRKKKKNESALLKSVNMRLENLLSLDEVEAAEKKDKDGAEAILEQLLQTCLEECEQTVGMVMALAVPTPTQDVFNNPELRKGGARCYVKFDSETVAEKGVSKMNGREFGVDNVIKASLVTDEEFDKASENVWV
ncbi:unnamed protein product [Bathycoccus prasinos]